MTLLKRVNSYEVHGWFREIIIIISKDNETSVRFFDLPKCVETSFSPQTILRAVHYPGNVYFVLHEAGGICLIISNRQFRSFSSEVSLIPGIAGTVSVAILHFENSRYHVQAIRISHTRHCKHCVYSYSPFRKQSVTHADRTYLSYQILQTLHL